MSLENCALGFSLIDDSRGTPTFETNHFMKKRLMNTAVARARGGFEHLHAPSEMALEQVQSRQGGESLGRAVRLEFECVTKRAPHPAQQTSCTSSSLFAARAPNATKIGWRVGR